MARIKFDNFIKIPEDVFKKPETKKELFEQLQKGIEDLYEDFKYRLRIPETEEIFKRRISDFFGRCLNYQFKWKEFTSIEFQEYKDWLMEGDWFNYKLKHIKMNTADLKYNNWGFIFIKRTGSDLEFYLTSFLHEKINEYFRVRGEELYSHSKYFLSIGEKEIDYD